MKKILLLDCASGISGDMFIGALMDCGFKIEALRSELKKVRIGGYKVSSRKVRRGGLTGVKFDVALAKNPPKPRRKDVTFSSISGLIKSSGLSGRVKEMSLEVFGNLAKAEGRVHGVAVKDVHFHEVGDIDSIVDIIGACVALEDLGISKVYASRISSGTGAISVHGAVFPNPAPATAYLLEGFEVSLTDIPYEIITPTGAALIKTFCSGIGGFPKVKILRTGYGAGSLELTGMPNLLRATVAETAEGFLSDRVTVLETNIDDMNPQIYDHLMRRLFEAGALDVYVTPVMMKKSRPGCVLTAVCAPALDEHLAEIIFEESSTFGIRRHTAERIKLQRKIVEVNTKYGKINVKSGSLGGGYIKFAPEFEDCSRIAKAKNVPFAAVWREAESKARKIKGRYEA